MWRIFASIGGSLILAFIIMSPDLDSLSSDKSKNINGEQGSSENLVESVFYVNSADSNLRACPSTDCDVISKIGISTITINSDRVLTLQELPEWDAIRIGGIRGYYHKSILSVEPLAYAGNKSVTDDYLLASDIQRIKREEAAYAREITSLEATVSALENELKSLNDQKLIGNQRLINESRERQRLAEEELEDMYEQLDVINRYYDARLQKIESQADANTATAPVSIYKALPIPQPRGYIQCGSGSGVTICDYKQ